MGIVVKGRRLGVKSLIIVFILKNMNSRLFDDDGVNRFWFSKFLKAGIDDLEKGYIFGMRYSKKKEKEKNIILGEPKSINDSTTNFWLIKENSYVFIQYYKKYSINWL